MPKRSRQGRKKARKPLKRPKLGFDAHFKGGPYGKTAPQFTSRGFVGAQSGRRRPPEAGN